MRACADCGADISERYARLCKACAKEHRLESYRERNRKTRAANLGERACTDCAVDISALHGNAQRCSACSMENKLVKRLASTAKYYANNREHHREYYANNRENILQRLRDRYAANRVGKVYVCAECKVDISDRNSNARRCRTCQNKRENGKARARYAQKQRGRVANGL